jgi:hypothetical protein
MEASFESVDGFIPWKADRKLAYGLVKIKKPFFHKAIGSATRLYFFKWRLHTYSDRPFGWN